MRIIERDVLKRFDGLTPARLELCVAEAWGKPAVAAGERLYDEIDLARIALIPDLWDDLEVNEPALPIILSLIDRVNALQARLRALDRAAPAGGDDGLRDALRERLLALGMVDPQER